MNIEQQTKTTRQQSTCPTLHIEHPIGELRTWLTAFQKFSEARRKAGVRAARVYQPVGDSKYIVLDLDFDTVDQAVRFKEFLESNVWSSRDASPALAGAPQARVLESVLAEHWRAHEL